MRNLLPLFVALPLAGAFLIPLLTKIKNWLGVLVSNIITTALFGLALLTISETFWGKILVYRVGGHQPPFGIILAVDALSALLVFLVATIGLTATIFSIRYLESFTGWGKFYSLLMLLLAGMNGISLTGDLFNLFVFLEISAITSYALVSFGLKAEGLEASFKYMVLGEIAGLSILLGIALLYAKTGTLNMADLAQTIALLPQSGIFWFIIFLFLFGFMTKAAVIPFHFWLPDAYQNAPIPIATILAGVFGKVAGIYALSRIIFNIFNLSRATNPQFFNLILFLGICSLILGGFFALNQSDYKRLLAYSSISAIGYIFVGLGLGNFWGVSGAVFFIFAHALTKGLLFLTAGSVENTFGLSSLDGLVNWEKRLPVTGLSFNIGLLSLSGIPPFPGFFAKLFIILGALVADQYVVAIICALFSTLTLAYLLKVWRGMVSRSEEENRLMEPATMRLAMLLLVIFLIAAGIGFQPVLNWLVEPAANALLGGITYAQIILGG
ncbi:MAG: proton-conducting transporter membrane subunit [candidate division WOR-3 bacterium]